MRAAEGRSLTRLVKSNCVSKRTNGQQLEVFLLLYCFKASGIHLELRLVWVPNPAGRLSAALRSGGAFLFQNQPLDCGLDGL